MWRTPEGERVLVGAEWELFRNGLCLSWDWIEDTFDDDDGYDFGVEAFDRLQSPQKLALLALVGTALKDESLPRPEFTSHNEAAIAAIFRQIKASIELEIVAPADCPPMSDPTSIRKLVLAAYREVVEPEQTNTHRGANEAGSAHLSGTTPLVVFDDDDEDRPWLPPTEDCNDLDKWETALYFLVHRILWDDDFDLGDELMDRPSMESGRLMGFIGIDDDYFTAIAPDPGDDELPAIREQLLPPIFAVRSEWR
jgi:hypothetical protein